MQTDNLYKPADTTGLDSDGVAEDIVTDWDCTLLP